MDATQTELRDGSWVAIRSIRREDLELERRFVDGLSPRTGHLRLLSGQETLRTAMAIGADRAILVQCDDELQPLAVAKLLKALFDKEQPGPLVILGKRAMDDDCSQTGRCSPPWPTRRRRRSNR